MNGDNRLSRYNIVISCAVIYMYRCGTPSQEWVLLYRASRDGFEAKRFHAACDEKGATLVLVKVQDSLIISQSTDVCFTFRLLVVVVSLEDTQMYHGVVDSNEASLQVPRLPSSSP